MRLSRLMYPVAILLLIYPCYSAGQQDKNHPSAAMGGLLNGVDQKTLYIKALLSVGKTDYAHQDYDAAARSYRNAADYGDAEAQFNLGSMYSEGRGVPQDYIQAHMWFNLSFAASTGKKQEEAAKARDAIGEKMTPQQLAEAQRLAREWKPRQWK